MGDRDIQSVGIDIGTTTTQLVFSALRLRNLAGPTQLPRYSITDREILYASPVAFTPLQERGRIDPERLGRMILEWYAQAGKTPSEVETGAVIITGESLKADNARSVVMEMTAALGDFVVATAGPHLESVLAGRGAGAAARSLARPGYHLNIDVGGGTSNYAVFERGKAVDTACLNVGGRLIRVDAAGGVTRVSAPAQAVVRAVTGGERPAASDLPAVAARMAATICGVLQGRPDELGLQLLQTLPLRQAYAFAGVSVSGGVGACCAAPGGNPYRYGDIGPLLADALRAEFAAISLPWSVAEQSVRATVIGAGAWSLTLSGGTVWAQDSILPLRNVPVAVVPVDWRAGGGNLEQAIAGSVARLDPGAAEHFILAFPAGSALNYAAVQWLAQGVRAFYDRAFPGASGRERPILAAVEDDLGKALGLELRSLTGRALVIIDEVTLEEGDYLDLARPFYPGGAVPLTVKSLAFPPARR